MTSKVTIKEKTSSSEVNIVPPGVTTKAKFGRTFSQKVRCFSKDGMLKLPSGQAKLNKEGAGNARTRSAGDKDISKSLWKQLLHERRMSRLVNHVTDTQKFYEEYVRLARERDDEENREKEDKGHVPVFNKRLFTSSGSVVITKEARRIMARNGRTRPDEDTQPLVKAELLAMRSVVSGLKMIHKDHDYIKKALCHCITFESYAAHQFIVKRPHEDCLSCYYILHGEVEVTYDIKVMETKRVYQPNIIYSHGGGEFLGLVSPDGLSEDISPPATIYTKEYCEFLRIDRTKFHKIIKVYDEEFTKEKRAFFSRRTSVLSTMSPDSKEKILSKISRQEYACNREVMRQGETSDYIYFVESGRCQLTRELYIAEADRVVSCVLGWCEQDQYFGEECIIDDNVSHCTATPTCPTSILKMHKSALEIVQKDQLHNIISTHRRLFPDDDDLRERGYRKTVWNNYKHLQVRQTLQESGNMQYLSRKTTQRVRKRPPTPSDQYKENMLEFVSNGSWVESPRSKSVAEIKTRSMDTSIRPWTALGISQRGEPDGQESPDPFDERDDSEKTEGNSSVESSPRTSSEFHKLPDRKSGKIPKDKIQKMLRESDPEDLMHHMEDGSELGKQLKYVLDTHKHERQNGFTKNSVLVTMTTEDIVRKAKAQAEESPERGNTDSNMDDRDWFTVLREENKQAQTNIVAGKYRAAILRGRLHALDRKRQLMNHNRTWRASKPGEVAVTPRKPKKYILDELQEKYQGFSYNDASKKLGTITFSTVFLCKALTARHRRTKSDQSIIPVSSNESTIQTDVMSTPRLERPSSATSARSDDREDEWISSSGSERKKNNILLRERLKQPTFNNYLVTSTS